MKKFGRVDANQKEIVSALRKLGCSVTSLANVGAGVPDLLVGYKGVNYLLEVKNGKKPPSERRLTSDQQTFHAHWNGCISVVSSAETAISAVKIELKNIPKK